MKRLFCLIFICSLIIGLTFSIFYFYGAPKTYAQDTAEKEDESLKCEKKLIKDRDKTEKCGKKLIEDRDETEEKHIEVLKKVHKTIIERTEKCRETLDSQIFTLQSLAKQAYKKDETESEKELLFVLVDYNSIKGDLAAMGVLLNMAEFAEGKEFSRYFDLMAEGYEYLKGDFNLKNELFLERLGKLKNKDALDYEKKLYGLFCEYFEYDLWQDKED